MMELCQLNQQLKSYFNQNSSKIEQLNIAQEYKAHAYVKKNVFHQAYANFFLAETFADMGELSISCDLLYRLTPFFREHKCYDYLLQVYLLLGNNENMRGNIENSVAQFNKAIQLNFCSPEGTARILQHMAKYLIQFGQYSEALKTIERALLYLSLKSKFQRKLYFQLLIQMAQVLVFQDKNEQSIQILDKIKKAQRGQRLADITTLLYQSYAFLFEKTADFSKAALYYKKAIKQSKQDESLLICLSLQVSLSTIYFKKGNFTQAEKLLLEVYHAYPYEENEYFLQLLSNLAAVYEALGNKKEQERFEKELCLKAT